MTASPNHSQPGSREAIARVIFDKACGIKQWDNDFYREERNGCFDTADAILALLPHHSIGMQIGGLPYPGKLKLVYVKRWRTLIPVPETYADEIVAALALPSAMSEAGK